MILYYAAGIIYPCILHKGKYNHKFYAVTESKFLISQHICVFIMK